MNRLGAIRWPLIGYSAYYSSIAEFIDLPCGCETRWDLRGGHFTNGTPTILFQFTLSKVCAAHAGTRTA